MGRESRGHSLTQLPYNHTTQTQALPSFNRYSLGWFMHGEMPVDMIDFMRER